MIRRAPDAETRDADGILAIRAEAAGALAPAALQIDSTFSHDLHASAMRK